ncbi:MAG: class I SAM-dependent methyltransferase [Cyanobacteria bacterium P01_D01_bin.105]
MSSAEFAQKRYDSFLNVLASRAGKTIESSSRQLLDVGCGTGEFLSVSSRDGWEVKGVEMSSDSTEIAAKKVGSQNVVCGDIYSPKLANRKFDIITSYHVIEHLLDPLSFLKQSYLLLKEGGVIFLETPNFGSFGARVRQGNWSQIKPPQHISFFTPFSLLFSLKKAGFQRTQTFTVAPTVIESTRELPPVIRALGDLTYEILPLFNMGATLQAIAFKD